ncbi:acyltransferase domain-containing protein [Thermocatellispora tengchongensis]|uniref:acyltransferase domain-containing protein n=1 Tax=Thermocatellispora tengchongensis TaxID=1073253 RepID=UPI0036283F79
MAIERLAADRESPAWSHPAGVHYRRRAVAGLKVGALFAGQGSQYVDMGLTTVLNNPLVGTAFDEANAAFAGAERTLAEVVYPPASFDGETRADRESVLRRTEYAQPGIGALSAGQYRFLTALGLECAAFLGHSFGELTALWAAGSLGDDAFFALARARGQAMESPPGEVDAGTMLAVEAGPEAVAELLRDHPEVSICNHNAPDQVVVGGATLAVVEVAATCKRRGIEARPLPVAAAFHTERVGHAVAAFREALAEVDVRAPRAPSSPTPPAPRTATTSRPTATPWPSNCAGRSSSWPGCARCATPGATSWSSSALGRPSPASPPAPWARTPRRGRTRDPV